MMGKDEASPEEMREAEDTQLKKVKTKFEEIVEQVTVQGTVAYLAEKETVAREATPEGMEFLGWTLDGWLVLYPLMDDNARPVYVFPREL